MSREVALESQHTDGGGYQPRSASLVSS
jgi:hypothetical protein